ncbi:hypothetical protein L208DRAFT_1240876, partial [Tricholoma matsutake]
GGLVRFESHAWMPSSVQEEGGLLSGSMDMIVVSELSQGKEIVPIILAFIDEDTDVLLQLLVDSFGLAISLWVISGRSEEFDTQKSVQLTSELCYQLRATVGKKDMVKIEVGGTQGTDSGVSGNEVSTFPCGINCAHHRIKPVRLWQLHHKVDTDNIPTTFWDGERV